MAIIRPCPKCQKPLSIPEPIPETIKCPACATVIRFKVPTAPPKEEPAAPAPAAVEAAEAEGAYAGSDFRGRASRQEEPEGARTVGDLRGTAPRQEERSGQEQAAQEAESSTGVLSYLHTVIPKPIVFGFYGALGGFLGVLLLGELFWLLHPTPQVVVPLHVKVSRDLIVYPGTTSIFQVKIKRQGFEGPVRVEKVSLPDGVGMSAVTIDADKDEADVEIKTEDDAKTGTYDVKMRIASTTDAKIEVSEKLQLYLQDPPPTLRASVSPFVTVFAGGKTKNRFDFKVQRLRFADRNFEGRVRTDVLEWPTGIDFEAVTLDKDKDQGTISVGAAKDAKVGAHALTMEVHSLDDHKVAFRRVFQLNVEPVPGNLRLNAPPQVTVFPGMKNRFTVKTLLQELKGPIDIEVSGAPRGATFTTATIAADQSEAVIEVTADKSMKTGEAKISASTPRGRGASPRRCRCCSTSTCRRRPCNSPSRRRCPCTPAARRALASRSTAPVSPVPCNLWHR